MRLPLLDAGSRACASCHGPCCLEHVVPLGGFDPNGLINTTTSPQP